MTTMRCLRCRTVFPTRKGKQFCGDSCRGKYNKGDRIVRLTEGNPDCTREARCGNCRKDQRAELARQRWADGTFSRASTERANAWSPDEVEFVARRAGTMSLAQITQELNDAFSHYKRTMAAVRCLCQNRGISRRHRAYSTESLGRVLGLDLNTIRRLIAGGYLAAECWGVGIRQKWVILPASAERFLRDYPWMYDLGGIDTDSPLFMVAASAHRRERWLGTKELALRVGSRPSYMRELAQRGVLPAQRRWQQWIFRASQLPEIRETLRRMHKQSKREDIAA
jgi:hypothetical protein